jgi:hypothetical protein
MTGAEQVEAIEVLNANPNIDGPITGLFEAAHIVRIETLPRRCSLWRGLGRFFCPSSLCERQSREQAA